MQGSERGDQVVNNGERYSVTIPAHHRLNDHVIYQARILDSAFLTPYTFYFRFKTLRSLHTLLSKDYPDNLLPQFPKTKSFAFWNRTNDDPTLIKERTRELEYYLTKLLNQPKLLPSPHIRQLHQAIRRNTVRRCTSQPPLRQETNKCTIVRECPELYRRALAVEMF